MSFPKQLTDETLYSRLIRHQAILGLNEKEYLKQFFNNPRLSIHPFITVGLTEIANISGDEPYELFRYQTLGSLFMYFKPDSGLKIYQSLLKNDGALAFRHSCLSNFRETKKVTINFCPACAYEDAHNFGVTYWHRIHQLPGMECCPAHRVRLIEVNLPERPHIKKGFLPEPSESSFCNEKHGEFSQFCFTFLQNLTDKQIQFDLDKLKQKMICTGYITRYGQVRRKLLCKDFFDFVQTIDFNHQDLLPKSEEDYRYLTNLLIPGSAQHPFKYLLFSFFLEHHPQKSLDFDKLQTLTESSASSEKVCIEILKKGVTLAEASRDTGKSVSYLKRLAGLNDIDVLKESISITKLDKASALMMAWKGFHRRIIANCFGVSIGTIEMLISSEKGLVEYRKKCKFESKRRWYKVEILRAVNNHPSWIRQQIKERHSAAFFWLYRYERLWLDGVLPKALKPKIPAKDSWKRSRLS
ncbi:TnsD family Tn7-like transposition protein [Thiomicrorhabdus sp. Kp2]|uniref:TnsD family Tn7-like transposition protein n=1 Tax=Thiomicrorhabdus sp. Kp2 TaxID=1123518 RepID=UPI0004240117|nr:TnsD family Tn7-like transposition protein [Thiomicrorhabdus sp. Kp2]